VYIVHRLRQSLSYRSRGLQLQFLKKRAETIRRKAEASLRSTQLRVSENFTFTIACLVGKKQFIDLLFTLLSFERSVGCLGNLTILSDGSLDEQDVYFLSKWHENCKVFLKFEDLCDYYHYKPHPTLVSFYNAHYLAPKLFLLNVVQSQSDCLLLDSDVVFFENPLATASGLVHALKSKICVCLEDEWESYDPAVIEYGMSRGANISTKVNTGLVYVPKTALNSIDWSQHIPSSSLENPHIFTEQSSIAASLETVGYSFLPKDKFVVSLRGTGFPRGDYAPFCDIEELYESLVCRHFVTPVRHLMWLKAFPLLKDKLALSQEGSFL